jgi:hypothetical protein
MTIQNSCKLEVRFICTTHNQPECSYFKKEWRQAFSTPNVCYFGLPDRKCSNIKANKRALQKFTVDLTLKMSGG